MNNSVSRLFILKALSVSAGIAFLLLIWLGEPVFHSIGVSTEVGKSGATLIMIFVVSALLRAMTRNEDPK